MYFTDNALLPENQDPLVITAAPWGPAWIPSDYPEDIAVSWDDQVQKAVNCYNAGATILHIHCRDPKTGKVAKVLDDYSYLMERLRKAVPNMILQLGGSIAFAPGMKVTRQNGWATTSGDTNCSASLRRPGKSRPAFTLATVNLLVQWYGLQPDAPRMIRLW